MAYATLSTKLCLRTRDSEESVLWGIHWDINNAFCITTV